MDIKLNSVEEAIEAIRKGEFVIVIDDESRENEGDFILAAEHMTPEKMNFMISQGRGLVCCALTERRCKELDLELMVRHNTDRMRTAFTVSVDKVGGGCTTGISAHDRSATMQALASPETHPGELSRPGHVFPLMAKTGGVLERPGHTEATMDLARLAGLNPCGALVEIMNEDGTMARLPELSVIAKQFQLKIVTIKDIIAYRIKTESLVEVGERVKMPTAHGAFELIPFRQYSTGLEHVALVKGTWGKDDSVLVRVHSSCVTGDIFSSQRCECGEQLDLSMKLVEHEGKGVIVYMNQEGRGIGLMNKMKAYKLQEQGLDTVDANLQLGFDADERSYSATAQILRHVGVNKVRLITNNPIKRTGLEYYGIEVDEIVPIVVPTNEHNERYMQTKANRMGHKYE